MALRAEVYPIAGGIADGSERQRARSASQESRSEALQFSAGQAGRQIRKWRVCYRYSNFDNESDDCNFKPVVDDEKSRLVNPASVD